MRRRPLQLALGTLVLAATTLTLTACGGGDAPGSIEDRAAKLSDDQLHRLSPAPSAKLSMTDWTLCKQEVPWDQRTATFTRKARLEVAAADEKQTIADLVTSWRAAGYTVHEPVGGMPWTEATAPNDPHWTVGIGILADGHLYLEVESDCLGISSDPPESVKMH